jgi:hypothetical protein
MIPALSNRGFGHGSGVLSPDGSRFILNIPKNASSFVLDWARRHDWKAALAQDVTAAQEMIVLLRDPVERWISGIAQYVNTYILSVHGPNGPVFPGEQITDLDYAMGPMEFIEQYTDVTERLIFDNAARFDDHVWPQSEIAQDVLPGVPRRYFRVDHDLERSISQYLGWRPMPGLDRNAGHAVPHMELLQNFFRTRLEMRPELVGRLRRQYQQDIDLMLEVLP